MGGAQRGLDLPRRLFPGKDEPQILASFRERDDLVPQGMVIVTSSMPGTLRAPRGRGLGAAVPPVESGSS